MFFRFISLFIMTLLTAEFMVSVVAQALPGEFVTGENATGVNPFSSYQGQRESIDLANLNLNVVIPLFTLKGRNGLDVPIVASYNAIQREWIPTDPDGIDPFQLESIRNGGSAFFDIEIAPRLEFIAGRYTVGSVTRYQNRFVFRSPDGSRSEFINKEFEDDVTQAVFDSLERFRTRDGTNMELRELVNRTKVDVYLKNGTQIRFENSGASLNTYARYQRDKNGNEIVYDVDPPGPTQTVTDTLGRVVTRTENGNSIEIRVKNGDGKDRVYTLQRNSTGTQQTLTLPSGLRYVFDYVEVSGLRQPPSFTVTAIKDRRLSKITYPTGGYTRYEWAVASLSLGGQTQLIRKHVSPTGLAVDENTYHYSRVVSPSAYTQVTRPTGDFTRHYFQSFSQPSSTKESRVENYTPSGSLLKTLKRDWSNEFGNARTIRETIILNDVTPNLHSKTEYDYDADGYLKSGGQRTTNGNIVEIREFDWGNGASGALLRRTQRSFLNHVNYNVDSRHILDLMTRETVSGRSSSGGLVEKARVDFTYDEYSFPFGIIVGSGAVGHDPAFGTAFFQRGNLSRVTRRLDTGADPVIRFRYDVFGNQREVQDPRGFKIFTTYTSATQFAYPTRVTDAMGFIVDYAYDFSNSTKRGFGLLVRQTDVSNGGLDTTFSYDQLGRPIRVDLPDGGRILSFHSDLDLLASHQGAFVFNERGTGNELPLRSKTFTLIESGSPPLEGVETHVFDGLGRIQLRAVSNGAGRDWTRTEYDSVGRAFRSSVPITLTTASDQPGPLNFTRWNTNRYDSLDRIIEVESTNGQKALTQYVGRAITVTDEAGNKRRTSSDGLGRVFQVREPNPTTGSLGSGSFDTFYAYDAIDNIVEVSQGAQTRRFVYDSLGRLTSESQPESGTTTFSYDAAGNLTRRTDARGIRTDYTGYDGNNRLGGISYSDSTPSVSLSYDSLSSSNGQGRLTGRSDGPGNEVFGYDPLGRISSHTRTIDGVTLRMDYAFNKMGGVKSTAYPGILDGSIPLTVFQEFDNAGRVISGRWSNGTSSMQNLIDDYTLVHNPSTGLSLESFHHANGTLETVTYNSLGQPRVRKVRLGAVTLMHLDYSFARPGDNRNNGNIYSVIDNVSAGQDQTYNYDGLNRLTSTSSPGAWSHLYSYDRYGNLTSRLATGSSLLGIALSASSSTNRFTDPGYSYDSAGNLINQPAHLNQQPALTFQWDGRGRLKSVDSGSTASYAYDADDQRIRKVAGGQTRLYFYDRSGNAVWEYVVGATFPWDTFNYYFHGQLKAVNSVSATSAPLWVHNDHLGSPRLKTKSSGAVASRDSHFPFGAPLVSGGDGVKLRFTGKELDSETELNYFAARYMNSLPGRFMSPDPIRFQSLAMYDPQVLNGYAYVRNNPLLHIDPTGETIELVGTPEQRKAAFEALKELVGPELAQFLVIKEESGRFFVELEEGALQHAGSFSRLGRSVVTLIHEPKLIAITAIEPDDNFQFKGQTIGAFRIRPGTTRFIEGTILVAVLDTRNGPFILPSHVMSDGQRSPADTALILAHELGHAAFHAGTILVDTDWKTRRGVRKGSNKASLLFENRLRRMRDPAGPERTRH